jgi:hypothetical protein
MAMVFLRCTFLIERYLELGHCKRRGSGAKLSGFTGLLLLLSAFSVCQLSPRRRGLTFLLDEKSKQKNQENFNALTAQTENFQYTLRLLLMPVASNWYLF